MNFASNCCCLPINRITTRECLYILFGNVQPQGVAGLFVCLVFLTLFYVLRASSGSNLPIINDKSYFELSNKRSKQNFIQNGRRLLREGLNKFGGKPFKILTDFGYATVLPPEYANEVRNIDSLSHVRAIAKVCFACSDDNPCLDLFKYL